jgi:plastocyanin
VRRLLPFAVLAGCLAIGVLPALAANQDVAIRDFSFTPSRVAVKPGESVSWVVELGYSGAMHNVHFDDQTEPLGPVSATFSGSRRFDADGIYPYHCDTHPTLMRGTVYVNATGSVPTTSPTATPTTNPPASPSATPTNPAGGSGGSGGSGGGAAGGGGSTTAAVESFRLRATTGRRGVLLTVNLGAEKAVRVRGTLRRGTKRVRSVSILVRPGRHKVRLPGKKLKPGRYTLTLRAGGLKRTVKFRVRR